MDIQYVADPYSCIMYVLSYVMKCENGMSEILKCHGQRIQGSKCTGSDEEDFINIRQQKRSFCP